MSTKAPERLEEFGLLARSLAHDLRSPLSVIRFTLFNLRTTLERRGAANGVAGDVGALCQGINDQVNRMDAALRDFLQRAGPPGPPQREQVPLAPAPESAARLADPIRGHR